MSKINETTFRAFFENSADAMLIIDDGKFVDCNFASVALLGYDRKEDIVGKPPHKTSPEFQPDARLSIDKAVEMMQIARERGNHRFEWDHQKKDGSIIPIEVSLTAIKTNEGLRLYTLWRDLSKRREAEQAREILEAQLNQAHKMEAVGTMAGGIAHDFNNLLTIITGNIDIIQKRQNDPVRKSEKNIEHIKNAADRATALVRQILSFSRQEKNDLVPVNLSFVVDETLKLIRSTIPATVEILNTVEKIPIIIKADTTQLQQVFINLCTNAVHAMNEKGMLRVNLDMVKLTNRKVLAVTDQPTGQYAELSISDTGSGMSDEIANKIFDPFFTTKEVGTGTGMGLSVVHGIVKQHGGFITVDSAPGKGSTFNIYFPVVSTVNENPDSAPSEALPGGTESILFVDDEEFVSAIGREMLEQLGYRVASLTSSIDALDLFKANPDQFDLVFTDQTMPEMTGTEFAEKLLAIRPDIPIILCSGYSAKVSEEDAKGIGIREFCMKPMDMNQLAHVARRVLDKKKPS